MLENAPSFPSGRPLRIAIVGAGSIGLYYGIKLSEAGCDVHFLMRSGFREAKSHGIHLHSLGAKTHLPNPKVFLDSKDIGQVDCVLISIKATSNSILETVLPPLLTSNTAILTLQNGLGNEEFLSTLVSPLQILGALCFICLTRSSPATVHHTGGGVISIGEFSEKKISPRVETLVALLKKAGAQAQAIADLKEERWRKLVWNIPFNGLAVSERKIAVDKILSTPQLLTKCKNLMDETISAANALGVHIESGYRDVQLQRTYPMGSYRPSTLIDFEAGKPFEVEAIWGIPLRQAQSVGLRMPHLTQLYKRLYKLNGKLKGTPHTSSKA